MALQTNSYAKPSLLSLISVERQKNTALWFLVWKD